MLVAGVDLSGVTTGVTAVAWLEGDTLLAVEHDRKLRDNVVLGQRLRERSPTLVAIDAPLTLPHAVTCKDDSCPACLSDVTPRLGSRAADLATAWKAVGHVEKPPMPSAMLAAIAYRAIHLARLLRGIEVIETWPMGVYRVLARAAGDPGAGDETWRRRLLARKVEYADGVHGIDQLDAVAAAYAGYCKLDGRATAVGDPKEGVIWVPRA